MKLRTFKLAFLSVCIIALTLSITPNLVSAAQGKVIQLKFAHFLPPIAPIAKTFEAWDKKVEAQTGGRVKIVMYPSQSLVKAPDSYTAPAGGICDLSFVVNLQDLSRFPLNSITDLPLMPWPSDKITTRIYTELNEKFPEMRNEFKEVKVLWRFGSAPSILHTTKKEVRVPQDIKGLKVIANGPKVIALKNLGANPIAMHPPEWYMALERGVAEGFLVPFNVPFEFKVLPMLKVHTDLNIAWQGAQVVMNLKQWNKLPADLQKTINDLNPWALKESLRALQASIDMAKGAAKKMDHKIIVPTPEESNQWFELLKPMQEEWVAQGESKGLPARAVFDTANRLIRAYSK